jgi:hypothetical protein
LTHYRRVHFVGKPRDIVSPFVVEVVIQEHGWKQAEFERRAGREPLDDLPGALIFFVRVGPRQVEVELVGVGLGQELAAAGEGSRSKNSSSTSRCTVSTSLW